MSSLPEPPSWAVLLTLMVHGPEPTLRGSIRSTGEEGDVGWFTWGDEPVPVFAGVRVGADPAMKQERPLRVWKDGLCLRVEEEDGTVNLIASTETVWQFDREHPIPVASPRRALRYAVAGLELLGRRPPQDWTGDDFTRPTGAVGAATFLGRPAWTVELAPPAHKPYPIQLVVDAETGMVLQQRNDGAGLTMEWVEFAAGEPLDPHLFTWTGSVRPPRDHRAEWKVEHDLDTERRRSWFATNVAALPLQVTLELAPLIHEYDETTGAFQASLGEAHLGHLSRRPRSNEPWELGWSAPGHRWSTSRWDWALDFFDDHDVSAEALEAFKQQLDDT